MNDMIICYKLFLLNVGNCSNFHPNDLWMTCARIAIYNNFSEMNNFQFTKDHNREHFSFECGKYELIIVNLDRFTIVIIESDMD